jgi:ribonuclease BN (tRNA processing enzyme)
MHEAWFTEDRRRENEIHSSGRDAGVVARDAGVERLVLIHLDPLGGHEAVLAEARAEFPAAELGFDGLEL